MYGFSQKNQAFSLPFISIRAWVQNYISTSRNCSEQTLQRTITSKHYNPGVMHYNLSYKKSSHKSYIFLYHSVKDVHK